MPAENRPHVLFDQLFRPDTPETLNQREAEFARRASVLDSLREQARKLSSALGADDQHKLDEYLTGIRDLERRMQDEKDWLRKPKPKVATLPFGKEQGLDPDKAGLEYRRYQRLMFDVIALALQTDSTRVICVHLPLDTDGKKDRLSRHGKQGAAVDYLREQLRHLKTSLRVSDQGL